MTRDGATRSIWQTEPDFQPTSSWAPAEPYDVLVVGAGVTGLTTALLLQEKGQRVLVAESYQVGWGTSGATTAHLNTMLDTPYSTVVDDFGEDGAKLLHIGAREAIDLVEDLTERYAIDSELAYKTGFLFAETGDETKALDTVKKGADQVGMVANWTDSLPIPVPHQKVLRVELQGQFHPTKYLHGLVRAFESLGGTLLQACRVGDVTQHDGVFEAESTLGTLRAKKIVWATHIPPGINLLHFRNAPYRSYVLAARLANPAEYPDALVYDGKDPYHYYRTQTIDGVPYLVAGGADHKTGHEANTEHVFNDLEAYLRTHFAIERVDFRWSSQYYVPSDGLPYIGALPGQADQYCATGFSGNGMTLGTLAGQVLCDLLTRGESRYEALFSPSRIKPIAGFMEFVKENADVVREFIGKRFAYESISELAEIAPGEARLVKYDGRKLGIYKDEAGVIHAVNPVCTHAKCIVAWNTAERSWDCPCHGARFDPNGTVITGPARHSLELVQWKSLDGD